jgi:hypothetical protein
MYYDFLNATGDLGKLAADLMEPVTSVFANDTQTDALSDFFTDLLDSQSDTIMSQFSGGKGLQQCADTSAGVHKAGTFQEWIERESLQKEPTVKEETSWDSPTKAVCGSLYWLGEAFNVLGNFFPSFFKNYENNQTDCGSVGVTILPSKFMLKTFYPVTCTWL